MKAVHEELKEARVSRNITLKTISEKTKIRLDFLERLDEGDYSIAPMPYIRAFLKEYAEYVGVDPNLIIQRLDNKIDSIFPDRIQKKLIEESVTEPEIISDEKTEKPEMIKKSSGKAGKVNIPKPVIVTEEYPEKIDMIQKILIEESISIPEVVCEEYPETKTEQITEDHPIRENVALPEELKAIETEESLAIKQETENITQQEKTVEPELSGKEVQEPTSEQPESSGKRSTIEINEPRSYSTWIFAAFVIIITIVALIIFFINKG